MKLLVGRYQLLKVCANKRAGHCLPRPECQRSCPQPGDLQKVPARRTGTGLMTPTNASALTGLLARTCENSVVLFRAVHQVTCAGRSFAQRGTEPTQGSWRPRLKTKPGLPSFPGPDEQDLLRPI